MGVETGRVFEAIGLTAEEEDLYLMLLTAGPAAAKELGAQMQWPLPRIRSVATLLEAKGFATQSPAPGKAYVAVAPDAAVELLALRREEEIARARAVASQLAAEVRARFQRRDPAELVEVVAGQDAVLQRVGQLLVTARQEVAVFSKPPYLDSPEASSPGELQVLARGIPYRMLYQTAGLEEHPPERIRRDLDAGEDARVLDELPMKLLIVDNRVAVTPVGASSPDAEPAALVLHAESVVKGLKVLFELLWERAVPIGVTRGAERMPGVALDDTDIELLRLAAAGFTDDVIARQMHLDPRTVRRRIKRMMNALGAHTRFQAGMQVVRHGFIT